MVEGSGIRMPASSRGDIPLPGAICQPDPRRGGTPEPHVLLDPAGDVELQRVYQWFRRQQMVDPFRSAIDDAIRYVLEGEKTRRFTLTDPAVDSDERASVGTKLQYRLIERLGLKKEPPLDTNILGVAVEIKGTTRKTWMIPREGQCEVTILVRIDAAKHEFEASLMRTHRAWLTGGKGNRDLKRSPRQEAHRSFSLPLVPPTSLPDEPLRALTSTQLDEVLGEGGLRKRLIKLFSHLPETVIPRGTITIVGAGLGDPMKRAREAKAELRRRGLVVLVGTWKEERELASLMEFDISGEAWVAVTRETFEEFGLEIPEPR